MRIYKGHTIKPSNCSTTVYRTAFGRPYQRGVDLLEVTGPVADTRYDQRDPRLLTLKDAVEYINDAIAEQRRVL